MTDVMSLRNNALPRGAMLPSNFKDPLTPKVKNGDDKQANPPPPFSAVLLYK